MSEHFSLAKISSAMSEMHDWKSGFTRFQKARFPLTLVASEVFRIGYAQSCETNRTGRQNIFRSVRI